MREDVVWPKCAESVQQKADDCEAEITALLGDLHSFVREQREENARLRTNIDHLLLVQGALTTECESLRKQIERLEQAMPPKPWTQAVMDAVRSHRIRFSA